MKNSGQFVVHDLTGQRFGRLVVLRRDDEKRRYWLCQCECGNSKTVFNSSLTRGHTKSCGCYASESASKRQNATFLKHGFSRHRLYRVYADMKDRCENSKNENYKNYGGRGIKCLFQSGEQFVMWGLDNGWEEGLTIDRINNNGDYEPNNCRWATRKQQMRNMRRNRIVEIGGVGKTLVEWAEERGINYATVKTRLHRGQSAQQALEFA